MLLPHKKRIQNGKVEHNATVWNGNMMWVIMSAVKAAADAAFKSSIIWSFWTYFLNFKFKVTNSVSNVCLQKFFWRSSMCLFYVVFVCGNSFRFSFCFFNGQTPQFGSCIEELQLQLNFILRTKINKDVLVTKSGKPLYTYSVDTK